MLFGYVVENEEDSLIFNICKSKVTAKSTESWWYFL